MDSNIVTHLVEIKERLAGVEAKLDAQNSHAERIAQVEQELVKVKTSVGVFKWLIGIIIALGAGVMKVVGKQ